MEMRKKQAKRPIVSHCRQVWKNRFYIQRELEWNRVQEQWTLRIFWHSEMNILNHWSFVCLEIAQDYHKYISFTVHCFFFCCIPFFQPPLKMIDFVRSINKKTPNILDFFSVPSLTKKQSETTANPRHPDKPMMFACADCPRRGFCGSSPSMRKSGTSRGAVARLGLSNDAAERSEVPCTSEEVLKRVEDSTKMSWKKTITLRVWMGYLGYTPKVNSSPLKSHHPKKESSLQTKPVWDELKGEFLPIYIHILDEFTL